MEAVDSDGDLAERRGQEGHPGRGDGRVRDAQDGALVPVAADPGSDSHAEGSVNLPGIVLRWDAAAPAKSAATLHRAGCQHLNLNRNRGVVISTVIGPNDPVVVDLRERGWPVTFAPCLCTHSPKEEL